MNGEYSNVAVAADPPRVGRLGRTDLAGPMVAALGALGSASFALSMPAVPDHGYQFYLATRILNGAKLYVDVAVADMHPPLFTWLAAGLELLARGLHTSGLTIYPAFVSLLIGAALYALWQIGPRSAVMLSVFVLALLPLSGPYFGQGEHLAIVVALPYLAATAASAGGAALPRPARFAIAVAAALGLAMKPHFALVWVVAELYHARRRGVESLFRLESLTIGSVFVLYVLATWIVTPEFFPTLPWLMTLYPRYAPVPFSSLIIDWRMLLLLAGLVASRLDRTDPDWNRLADVFALAAVAMYAAVLLQLKGWGYHWYPVNVLSLSMIAAGVRRYAERKRVLVPAAALAGVVWMNAQVDRTGRLLAAPPGYLGQLMESVERHARGGPIVALAHTIHVGFPLVNFARVDWASPYACLWMIPAMYEESWNRGAPWHYRENAEWEQLEQEMFDRLWTAIEEKRPTVMLVEVPLENGFNTAAYFATDPRFRDLFQRARVIETVGQYAVVSMPPH